jgi:hypothetical protein
VRAQSLPTSPPMSLPASPPPRLQTAPRASPRPRPRSRSRSRSRSPPRSPPRSRSPPRKLPIAAARALGNLAVSTRRSFDATAITPRARVDFVARMSGIAHASLEAGGKQAGSRREANTRSD